MTSIKCNLSIASLHNLLPNIKALCCVLCYFDRCSDSVSRFSYVFSPLLVHNILQVFPKIAQLGHVQW
jgi:hypothetical protein